MEQDETIDFFNTNTYTYTRTYTYIYTVFPRQFSYMIIFDYLSTWMTPVCTRQFNDSFLPFLDL